MGQKLVIEADSLRFDDNHKNYYELHEPFLRIYHTNNFYEQTKYELHRNELRLQRATSIEFFNMEGGVINDFCRIKYRVEFWQIFARQ